MRRIATTLAAFAVALLLVGLLVFGVLQTGGGDSIDQALARGEHPVAHDARLPPLAGGGRRTLAVLPGTRLSRASTSSPRGARRAPTRRRC